MRIKFHSCFIRSSHIWFSYVSSSEALFWSYNNKLVKEEHKNKIFGTTILTVNMLTTFNLIQQPFSYTYVNCTSPWFLFLKETVYPKTALYSNLMNNYNWREFQFLLWCWEYHTFGCSGEILFCCKCFNRAVIFAMHSCLFNSSISTVSSLTSYDSSCVIISKFSVCSHTNGKV